MDVEIISSPHTDNLEKEWSALEYRAQPSFFLRWPWIGAWLRLTNAPQWLLRVCDGGDIVGLGVLCAHTERRRKFVRARQLRLHETGAPDEDVITVEYNGFLCAPGREAEVWTAALDALLRSTSPDWDELVIGGATPEVEARLLDVGLPVERRGETTSAFVDLAALRASGATTLDDYAASLGKSTRGQLRRAIRLYEERGPLSLEAVGPEGVEDFLTEIAAHHQARWEARGKPGAFGWPFYVAFHRALIADCLPRGEVELLRARTGDQAFAWLYNFVEPTAARYYLGGFAFEEDNRVKPGLVAHALATMRHLKAGRDSYDFMGGDNRYKMNLGQQGPDILSLSLQKQRAVFALERLALKVRAKLARG